MLRAELSIVSMALFRISEVYNEILVENRIFGTPPLYSAPVGDDPISISQSCLLWKNYNDVAIAGDEKV